VGVRGWIAVAIGLLAAAAVSKDTRGRPSRESFADSGVSEDETHDGDVFIYEVAAHFNEMLVASTDAVDTALTAVLAGDIAALLFAIDKLRELQLLDRWCAVILLCASIVCCGAGYVTGLVVAPRERDGITPRDFIADVLVRPHEAMLGAVKGLIRAAELNGRVRVFKRGAVVAAMILLILGAGFIGLARLAGVVVR
jgi:hypothetical protein